MDEARTIQRAYPLDAVRWVTQALLNRGTKKWRHPTAMARPARGTQQQMHARAARRGHADGQEPGAHEAEHHEDHQGAVDVGVSVVQKPFSTVELLRRGREVWDGAS